MMYKLHLEEEERDWLRAQLLGIETNTDNVKDVKMVDSLLHKILVRRKEVWES